MTFAFLTSGGVLEVQFWICLILTAYFGSLLIGRTPDSDSTDVVEEKSRSRWITGFLLVVALASSLNYFYLSRTPNWVHRWDLFHTLITTRYFDELGYFGLYDGAITIDAETNRHYEDVSSVRDLRTLQHIPRSRILKEGHFQGTFTPRRKAAFVADLRFFNSINSKSRWKKLFRDKGYNGTPFYTFLVQKVAGPFDLTRSNLYRMGLIDLALLALAFFSVYRAYGLRTMLLALTFFCVIFPNRFTHMGGSILRFDYVAYLVIGVSMLRQGNHAVAGALFGMATMERLFPALFLVGYGLKAVFDWIQLRSLPVKHQRFLISATATMVVCFLLTLTVCGGFDIWLDFFENMKQHTQNTAGFRVGFKHMFMLEGNLRGSDGFVSFAEKTALFESSKGIYWACVGGFLLATLWLLPKLDEGAFTIVFGVLGFFLLLTATRYYYSLLVLLFLLGLNLERQRVVQVSCMLLSLISAVCFRVFIGDDFAPFVYNTLLSGMLTVYFAVLLLWLAFRRGNMGNWELGSVAVGGGALPSSDSSGNASPRTQRSLRHGSVLPLVVIAGLLGAAWYGAGHVKEPAIGKPKSPSMAGSNFAPAASATSGSKQPLVADAPELDAELLASLADIAVDALEGRTRRSSEDFPAALAQGPGLVYACVRDRGKKRGTSWAEGTTWLEAVDRAVRDAQKMAGKASMGESDSVELVLAYQFKEVDVSKRKNRLSNMQRGVRGLEIDLDGEIHRFAPTEMVASNRSFERQIEVFLKAKAAELALEAGRVELRTFEGRQVLVSRSPTPRVVEMFRGNQLIGYQDITKSSVEAMARRMGDWMIRNVRDDGRMTYKYWPSSGRESASNNMIRQWMATICLARISKRRGDPALTDLVDKNIRYNLEKFFHLESDPAGTLGIIEFDGKIKLGAVALAGLALFEHERRGDFRAQEDALRRTTEAMWRSDGSFLLFWKPRDREDGNNFYPGETLLWWANLLDEREDPELRARFLSSVDYFREWHLSNRNPAFIPWHTQAYYSLWLRARDPDLAEWVLEMNDWLLDMQTRSRGTYDDTEGRFYDPSRPFGPPHASSTGVYLEGLIDAYRLAQANRQPARAERYRRSILGGIRSSMQLEFGDEVDMFFVSKRDAVRGGLRTTVYNNEIRVDNVQHTLMGLFKVLETFSEEDFRLDRD